MDNQLNRFEITVITNNVKWVFFAAAGNAHVSLISSDATTAEHLHTTELSRAQVRDYIRELSRDI